MFDQLQRICEEVLTTLTPLANLKRIIGLVAVYLLGSGMQQQQEANVAVSAVICVWCFDALSCVFSSCTRL